MLFALWVSLTTKVNVWPPPVAPLGDIEPIEGCGGGTLTVQEPRNTKLVVEFASAAYRKTLLLPGQLG